MRFFLRKALLLSIAYGTVACSHTWQNASNQGTGSELMARPHNEAMEGEWTSQNTEDLGPQALAESLSTTRASRHYPAKEGRPPISETANDSVDRLQVTCRAPQQILQEALGFCQASQDYWEEAEYDKAIDALDQAYGLLLAADPNGKMDLAQQKENIRLMLCKRMLEIYASRHSATKGSGEAIPMVMNQHVEREIRSFKGPERGFFLGAYKRSGRYRPEIVEALEKAGLPEELSWLPLVESGFKVNAFSKSRALGLWQFIPSTGYRFGLNRNEWIDERMDVQKSTQAAIEYLKELHRIFGDWCTALAAYNCGEAKVLNVIRNQRLNYLDSFWDLFERLPRETARYVPRFLATLLIVNQPDRFGFKLNVPDSPISYQPVITSKQLLLKQIAKALNMPHETLEDLNSELRLKITPPTPYSLKVPRGMASLLIGKLAEIPEYAPPQKSLAYHRVQKGETLSHLAQRYRTSIRAIMEANHMRRQDYLSVGQKLRIPSGRRTHSRSESPPRRYLVRQGDSLWLLAKRYRTDIRQIMHLNNLHSPHISVGQELILSKTDSVD